MSNIEITNIDKGVVRHGSGTVLRDETLTAAAGGAHTFNEGTILARDSGSGKLVAYVKGGVTNENGIPKAVLPYELSVDADGDYRVRALVKGDVKKERLVIDADGDDSNIDDVVLDELRDYGIAAVDVEQLSELDNQ